MRQGVKDRCPGCGLELPQDKGETPERYHASAACWALFMELSAAQLSEGDYTFIHQMALDAYGAQHSGGMSRNITTAYSLIGLHLAVEHRFTGRQVQRAHMELAKQRRDWPQLEPPKVREWVTVKEVLGVPSGPARDEMLKRWAASVWQAWQDVHEWVRVVSKELLPVEQARN